MDKEQIMVWANGWKLRESLKKVEIINLTQNKVLQIDQHVALIWWQLINGLHSVEAIISILKQIFPQTTEKIEPYVLKTLTQFYKQGVIQKQTSGGPEESISDQCVITFCVGEGVRYPATDTSPAYSFSKLIQWVEDGLTNVGYRDRVLSWTGKWPESCPPAS